MDFGEFFCSKTFTDQLACCLFFLLFRLFLLLHPVCLNMFNSVSDLKQELEAEGGVFLGFSLSLLRVMFAFALSSPIGGTWPLPL